MGWARDYDPDAMYNVQRELFASGPSAVTSVPSGFQADRCAPRESPDIAGSSRFQAVESLSLSGFYS